MTGTARIEPHRPRHQAHLYPSVIGRIGWWIGGVKSRPQRGLNHFKRAAPATERVIGTTRMKLTIVIPAYNEEPAIASIIE